MIDGTVVRVMIPSMTEDNRKKMVKHMKEQLEETRIQLRGVREDIRGQIMQKEKDKEIGEDDKFKMLDELEKLTKQFVDESEAMAEKKEQEIMTV